MACWLGMNCVSHLTNRISHIAWGHSASARGARHTDRLPQEDDSAPRNAEPSLTLGSGEVYQQFFCRRVHALLGWRATGIAVSRIFNRVESKSGGLAQRSCDVCAALTATRQPMRYHHCLCCPQAAHGRQAGLSHPANLVRISVEVYHSGRGLN